MQPPPTFELVPASLLILIASALTRTQAREIPWPFGSLSSRSSSRNGISVREEEAPETNTQDHMLVGVRRMSGDQGEMFFPEYWSFQAASDHNAQLSLDTRKLTLRPLGHIDERYKPNDWANASISQPLRAPFALHSDQEHESRLHLSRLLMSPRAISALDKRQFQCPGSTVACTSINRPDSCCATGTTCNLITDTGYGDVGCCGQGDSCTGKVEGCPSGDTACSESSGSGSTGGGCCISGYTCKGAGCVADSTVTTTVQPVVTASPSTRSTSNTIVAGPLQSASTDPTTATSTSTAVTSVISTVTSEGPTRSPSSTHSTTSITSSALVAPVRPTSASAPTTTTTAPPTTITASNCPTGYYQCSAYYHAGCCQVGRDCGLTSCPAASSTIALTSNGVVVAVPTGNNDAALGQNGCALGWFSCAAGQGGGCCPSGYACGTSCTATAVVVQGGATGTAKVAKESNGAGQLGGKGWTAWTMVGMMSVGVLIFF